MGEEICDKDHTRHQEQIDDLPRSQKMIGRHRCVGCAFEAGYQQALEDSRTFSCDVCGETQAGRTWHCPNCSQHNALSQRKCPACHRNQPAKRGAA